LRYDAVSGNPEASFLYITEPLPAGANPVGKLTSNGLVDLLAIDDNRLLSLERAFSLETGTTIRIFEISLEKGDRIEALESLQKPYQRGFSRSKTPAAGFGNAENSPRQH
jgi:Uncharacterized protein conserved in bacteria